MKKHMILWSLFIVALLPACSQEATRAEDSPVILEGPSDQTGDTASRVYGERLVGGQLVEGQLWGVLKDFSEAAGASSDIVRYDLSEGSNEIPIDAAHDLVWEDAASLSVGTEISATGTLISFKSDSEFYEFALAGQENAVGEPDIYPFDNQRAYSIDAGAYVQAEDGMIRVKNTMNGKILWRGQDAASPLQEFVWHPNNSQFAYLAGQNTIRIISIVDQVETITSDNTKTIDLQDTEPEGLVDYYDLSWSADGTHLVIESFCEQGSILQVFRVSTGDLVYQYRSEGDCALMDVSYGNRLLVLDQSQDRKLIVCNYWTGQEEVVLQTDLYLHFADLNVYENKLIYDLYNPAEDSQTIQVCDLDDLPLNGGADPYEKVVIQEGDLAENLGVPVTVIDRLIDMGYIAEEISTLTRDQLKGLFKDSPQLLDAITTDEESPAIQLKTLWKKDEILFVACLDLARAMGWTYECGPHEFSLQEGELKYDFQKDSKYIRRGERIVDAMPEAPMMENGDYYISAEWLPENFSQSIQVSYEHFDLADLEGCSLYERAMFFPDELRTAIENPDTSEAILHELLLPPSLGIEIPRIDTDRLMHLKAIRDYPSSSGFVDDLIKRGFTDQEIDAISYGEYKIIIAHSLLAGDMKDLAARYFPQYSKEEIDTWTYRTLWNHQEAQTLQGQRDRFTEAEWEEVKEGGIRQDDIFVLLKKYQSPTALLQATDEEVRTYLAEVYQGTLDYWMGKSVGDDPYSF